MLRRNISSHFSIRRETKIFSHSWHFYMEPVPPLYRSLRISLSPLPAVQPPSWKSRKRKFEAWSEKRPQTSILSFGYFYFLASVVSKNSSFQTYNLGSSRSKDFSCVEFTLTNSERIEWAFLEEEDANVFLEAEISSRFHFLVSKKEADFGF